MYTKTEWVAPEGVNLNKYTKSAETSTSVILNHAPDEITVAGTIYTAARMNNIEDTVEQLSNLNVMTDIDDIPSLGTGVYSGTSITGAPITGAIVYEYKGEATAGILTARPVAANLGQVWERRRSGSAWVTGWCLISDWGTMALNTEYLTGYDVNAKPVYKQILSVTATSGALVDSSKLVGNIKLITTSCTANANNTYSGNEYQIIYETSSSFGYYVYTVSSDSFKIKNESISTNYYRIYATYAKL